ncbi:ADP-heptose:LPS heptosyltransferase [Pseudobutyrivibrio sp. 49]|uniref:glycosyltransferase family 9 protein n=1 Tax=Pseudobutyrivibrio sp. 49 TaxID=1855344 RepID=UPI000884766B|nr:glycosyltransferase family 9 protein [Pseudobutyrivibrio sp. 49]SDH92049.1 ADP-heptose:LPS heptosyltransferase [Pseudobutyrivibrio sp. 49]
MDSYQYLFPYEKIKPHSKVLIYGTGVMGQEYLRQILITGYCEVVGMIDKNYFNYSNMRVPVYAPDSIKELQYDYVVIALQKADWLNEILLVLKAEDVPESKIVYTLLRDTENINIFGGADSELVENPAYELTEKSIAISVTGGIGDMIIQKSFVKAICDLEDGCLIDIFNVDTQEMLEYLYEDDEHINAIIPNIGIRYELNHEKYALAIFIEGGAYIRVDRFNDGIFSENQSFVKAVNGVIEFCDNESANMKTPLYSLMGRRIYLGQNCYSWFGCGDALNISDKVDILLTEGGKRWFLYQDIMEKQYITVNYGNGKCSDGSLVSKAWALEKFNNLVEEIYKRHPGMIVIQVGDAAAETIKGVNCSFKGEPFENLAYILKNSRLHIDIDGGLVHMATQLGTKCVVLFGPTPVEIYGYKQNINIVSKDCNGCFGLYKNMYQCAKGYEKPLCMENITVEMVMDKVDEVLGGK